jgi:uncharacterized integral membrane protein (TIGR00697 family)|tara:strand:- start:15 stop:584 length:570 start_codon:yes stop_codon:yes gene_type:complete
MNKELCLLVTLSLLMAAIVIVSNYLVQFPIEHYNLEEVLTYGAFTYPITFLITDLANRTYGIRIARWIVIIGFIVGILLTVFISTNFSDLISIRIAIGSGLAFFIAQNLDIQIFDKLRKNINWYIAPFVSSIVGSIIDTFLFFFVAFYQTGIPWVSLAFGDLTVKILITLVMLVPFKMLLTTFKEKNTS